MRTAGLFAAGLMLLTGCSLTDEHRYISLPMTWSCKNASGDRGIQSVKLRFVANPHYWEGASAPGLCTALKASGQSTVDVKFDTWGNKYAGRHRYNFSTLSVAGKDMKIEPGAYSGFADTGPHYGNFSSV